MEDQSEKDEHTIVIITPEMQEAFERFVEYHPAKRFSRNVRNLFLEFLMYDGSAEAEYLRELVIDLDGLFSLLDVIIDEQKNISKSSDENDKT